MEKYKLISLFHPGCNIKGIYGKSIKLGDIAEKKHKDLGYYIKGHPDKLHLPFFHVENYPGIWQKLISPPPIGTKVKITHTVSGYFFAEDKIGTVVEHTDETVGDLIIAVIDFGIVAKNYKKVACIKYIKWNKPLFYTEDFKDGSFPMLGNCNTCVYQKNNFICTIDKADDCSKSNYKGKLKGEPIYEGDKCWRVYKGDKYEPAYIIQSSIWDGTCKDSKYFSHPDNAETYYNQLKWEGKLKFKVGDVICSDNVGVERVYIQGIDYLRGIYRTSLYHGNKAIVFEKQENWQLYKEPKFEVGKWYEAGVSGAIVLVLEDNMGVGFIGLNEKHWGEYSFHKTCRSNWKLANPDKVKELLLKEANRRYKVGDKFKCVNNNEESYNYLNYFTVGNINSNSKRIYTGELGGGFLFKDGKWAEIVKPKFTTADGVDKYEGDKYWIIRNGKPLIREVGKICNVVSDMANYMWDKEENAQQYLAEQLTKKRGIEVGTIVFDEDKKHIGKVTNIERTVKLPKETRLWFNNESEAKGKVKLGWYDLSEVLTIEEIAKEEGLEVGMELEANLYYSWKNESYANQYRWQINPTNKIDKIEILDNKPYFCIADCILPIIGFKKFKEEWEAKQKKTIEVEVPEGYEFNSIYTEIGGEELKKTSFTQVTWKLTEKQPNAEEEANKLGFKIGDKVWSIVNKEYLGEIKKFHNSVCGNVMLYVNNTTGYSLTYATNKVAIHTPTKEDFEFIKNKLNVPLKDNSTVNPYERFPDILIHINKKIWFTLWTNKDYLNISIDEYMQSIGEKPLFITSDNKLVWKDLGCWGVCIKPYIDEDLNKEYTLGYVTQVGIIAEPSKEWKCFSTKELAQEYSSKLLYDNYCMEYFYPEMHVKVPNNSLFHITTIGGTP